MGFPNAGKSSLIRCYTKAQPKVANYPFTTLHPSVGVLTEEGHRHLFMADIPGLIEGASQNKGLGYRFLRHIERCQALLMMIDMAGSDVREPWKDYEILRQELHNYGSHLTEKPFIVIANKNDLPEFAENLKIFKKKFPELTVLSISCQTGDGLETLRKYLFEHFVPTLEPEDNLSEKSSQEEESSNEQP